ncbi:MAG: GTP diphosphokinase [Halieaceae bacterium]|jgi:GTP pyrophosphokinase|nr:GTP diphosphokinase [Halieaceae bacterium]
MVRVRAERDADAGRWLQEQLAEFPDADRQQVGSAFEMVCSIPAPAASEAGHDIWYGHGSCRDTGLDMVEILSELHMGADSLVAAMLYRAVAEGRLSMEDVESSFGPGVGKLLAGVQRMSAISTLNIDRDAPVLGQADAQKDNIRKMLIALVDDVRVALIKLAERTCAIRAVKNDEANRRTVAQEVFDVYAPLAHRLGIGHLKWELEDLSFRYLYQDAYHKIARLLDGKRLERDKFIERVKTQITDTLGREGIEAELRGRSKHIYSIWRKMQRKGIGFSQVYDIRAVRILVPTVKDCYAALGIVHGLWRNIPNEFDDYIANPKENGYRSLHTAVIGPEGKILEIQIRTRDMDEEAELGVCAHWRYKGSDREGGLSSSYEEKIAWLRQVLDWHEETGDVGNLAEQFSAETSQDRVYVFTPDGDVVNLASGATPLDFAYHVHTEVGHSCRGAKVNGSIVPLTYQLKTGERVQILTGNEASPKRDWLQPGLGYLKTSRARAKVQHWFRAQARDENVDAGRRLLEREFKRLALTSIDYKRVANRVQLGSVEDMYAAVGAGELSAAQVLAAAQSLIPDAQPTQAPAVKLRRKARADGEAGAVQVEGIGNLLSHLAGCCKPVPGDNILGFITQGRGVSVHRRDCGRLLHLEMEHPERIIEVNWGSSEQRGSYDVDIGIEAYDRSGLLRDITELLAAARINVLSINTSTDRSEHIATMRLRVEVPDLGFLGKLLNRISSLNNVISARRLSEDGVEQAG